MFVPVQKYEFSMQPILESHMLNNEQNFSEYVEKSVLSTVQLQWTTVTQV